MSMPEFDEYGEQKTQKNIPIVTFWLHTEKDEAASKREGRPIVVSTEMVTIAYPADRQRTTVRPAHSQWTKIGERIVTYVDRFPEHYKRYKADEPQIVEGTPISEAPFLDMNQREVLKLLKVFTVEQLASLSGEALKNLGPGGFAQQQKAVAYLENAKGSANVTAMAEENARLKQSLAEMAAQGADPKAKYAEWTDQALKDAIKDKTGEYPRGNPSRQTLIRMMVEAERGPVPEAQAAA